MIKHEYAELPTAGFKIQKSVVSVLRGTVIGYIFLIICFAILAVIYTYTSFPAGMLGPFTQAITALSIIICGILSARNISGFGWLHGSMAGLVYSVIRFSAGAMTINGFGFDKNVFSMLLLGLILGAAGGIIGINFRGNITKR